MQIYNYDHVTGQLLGPSMADADREQPGKWIFPAFSTPHEPPSAPAGYEPVFDRASDAWKLQPARVSTAAAQPADPSDPSDPAAQAKALRDSALRSSDWVILRAYEQGAEVPDAWKAYRQALRDVTAQAGFPDSINWPQAPDA